MIEIDKEFYLDCNGELHRIDEKKIKSKRKTIGEILSKLGYTNNGKAALNCWNTNQYIFELKRALKMREYCNFNGEQKQLLNKIFDKLDTIPKKESPDTFGHIFRHERRENFISDWLAYLFNLDKMGTNELFQSLFDLKGIEGEFIPTSGIEREKDLVYCKGKGNTVNCGRIDFFVETDNAIVGIENKIDCDFTSNNQLEKYSKSLSQIADSKGKIWYLFLLYPLSNKKISKDKLDQEKIKTITYEDLIKKWESIKVDCIKLLRQMIIFEDFIKHIKEYIIMDEQQSLNFTAMQFLDEKSKEIEQINTIKEAAKEQLNCYFRTKLQEFVGDKWKVNVSSGVQYIQCYKIDWEQGVHFELLNKVKKEDFSNFPPKCFHLEFHNEGVKNDNLEKLKDKFENEEKETYYELNYKDEQEFEKTVNEMLKKLYNTAKTYADEVDSISKN